MKRLLSIISLIAIVSAVTGCKDEKDCSKHDGKQADCEKAVDKDGKTCIYEGDKCKSPAK